MHQKRPSQKAIAERLGLTQATVSLALSGNHRIPVETRERVLKIAKEIQYVPDPMLSALAAYRKNIAPASYKGNLAWVCNSYQVDSWREWRVFREYHQGALERCRELGYKLEDIWVDRADSNPARISQILQARGIQGLLLIPGTKQDGQMGDFADLVWDYFSVVRFGYQIESPPMHRLATHHHENMLVMMETLLDRGYRRFLYASGHIQDKRTHGLWLGGFNWFAKLHPEARCRAERPANLSKEWLQRSIVKHRPDVVISNEVCILDWLREIGLRIPEDIAFASQAINGNRPEQSGLNEAGMGIGSAAVDLLISMIHRNEKGIPKTPINLLIQGNWHEGSTVGKAARR